MNEVPNFNSGIMPNTDSSYEEFEGLLGSYYLSLSPLQEGSETDKVVFQTATDALNKLAEGQGVQLPEAAVAHPRLTTEDWGQPHAFTSPSMLLDSFRSFYSDFGVGMKPGTPDFEQRIKLAQTVLGILDRLGVIKARFEENEAGRYFVLIENYDKKLLHSPLREVLQLTQ